jgi:hypothetical protein
MARDYIKVGLSNVGSYQVSGQPWLSGNIDASTSAKVQFPFVTGWVVVKNNHDQDALKVGFSALGIDAKNYMTVGPEEWLGPLEVKVTEMHFKGSDSVDVLAGLTNIPRGTINNPSNSPAGTNWSGSYVSNNWSPGI